jgi:hypothetical protein
MRNVRVAKVKSLQRREVEVLERSARRIVGVERVGISQFMAEKLRR